MKSLFILRKLDRSCYGLGAPAHPVRSMAHSFFFLTSGTVLVEIGGQTYLIKPGSFAIIPSGSFFSIKYYENSEGYMGSFDNKFISDISDLSIQLSSPLKRFTFIRQWDSPVVELEAQSETIVKQTFERIYAETVKTQGNSDIIKAYMNAVLTEAEAARTKRSKTNTSPNSGIGIRFLELLFSGKYAKQTVNEYARLLNVTPNHLNKMVKKLTLRRPSEWIEEAVIQEAKALLKSTELPLSDIAAKVGIIDQSYFSRLFKKRIGITPSEYRNR